MRSAKRLGPKSAGLGMGGFLHRLDLIFTDSKADVNKRVESDSRSAMSCKNDSFDKCPRAAVPLDTVKFAGIEQLNANRHKCGDLPVAPAHGSAALLQRRRVSGDVPGRRREFRLSPKRPLGSFHLLRDLR